MTTSIAASSSPPPPSLSPCGDPPAQSESLLPDPDGYRLATGTVVVRRTCRHIQIGLSPDRAVEVMCPSTVPPETLAGLLRSLDRWTTVGAAMDRAGIDGRAATQVREILHVLAATGHLVPDAGTNTGSGGAANTDRPVENQVPRTLGPIRDVHILGSGPLAQLLRAPIEVNGCRVTTSQWPGIDFNPERVPWRSGRRRPDLVLLTDAIVPDPLVTSTLVADGIPQLHVYCRDGRVVVGPTVLPGISACLRCMDLYRADRDAHWPHVAARLLGCETDADWPALAAGAALVLSEIAASRGSGAAAQTTGATVEINPGEGLWRRRSWPAHPRCSCGAAAQPLVLP